MVFSLITWLVHTFMYSHRRLVDQGSWVVYQSFNWARQNPLNISGRLLVSVRVKRRHYLQVTLHVFQASQSLHIQFKNTSSFSSCLQSHFPKHVSHTCIWASCTVGTSASSCRCAYGWSSICCFLINTCNWHQGFRILFSHGDCIKIWCDSRAYSSLAGITFSGSLCGG